MFTIDIADEQSALTVERQRIVEIVRAILVDHAPPTARVSIAVVDDATIHTLNRQYLDHDYPTDVLSFVLEQDAAWLEGEVIVSAQTAIAQAGDAGLDPEHELLLYVIHGVLHLVGFDDQNEDLRSQMRCAEQVYLEQFGLSVRP